MPTIFTLDADAFRRFAGDRSVLDPGAFVRETLSRTLGTSADQQPPSSRPSSVPSARASFDSSVRGGRQSALHDMLGRMSALKPVAPLCATTLPVQSQAAIMVPEGASFEERVFHSAAGSLAYRLYVPSKASGRAMPLVVMLHGCTQSPEDFAAGTRMNELAEQQGFIVAYPRQTQRANLQKCWNWFEAKDQHRDGGEPALIAGLTREILRDHAIDLARVYVAGLSAGGAAAAIMGQTYPDLYAAVGVHSGLAAGAASDIPSAFAAMRQGSARTHGTMSVPTIVFHGDYDRTVHPANGEEVLAQAGAGAALRSDVSHGRTPGGLGYTRTVQSDGNGSPLLELWTLHGVGHAWSGGNPAGSYTEPRGPDASREMMRFFLQHANTTIAS